MIPLVCLLNMHNQGEAFFLRNAAVPPSLRMSGVSAGVADSTESPHNAPNPPIMLASRFQLQALPDGCGSRKAAWETAEWRARAGPATSRPPWAARSATRPRCTGPLSRGPPALLCERRARRASRPSGLSIEPVLGGAVVYSCMSFHSTRKLTVVIMVPERTRAGTQKWSTCVKHKTAKQWLDAGGCNLQI